VGLTLPLAPIAFAYDARGRLIHLKQADRAWRYGYDGSGRLESVTDTLWHVTRFGYDAADRVTTQTMPDSQVVSYGYDLNGNLTSVTPPGRPAHGFDYTSVDLTQHYTPPDVGIGSTATSYTYSLDRQLTHVEHQGNLAVTLGYETTEGRLQSVAIPRGNSTLTYDPNTGQLATVSSPDSVILAYTYDGPLPLSETWSGRVAGHVDVTYDRDFRPETQSVNGSPPVPLRYDLDGLLAGAGVDSLYRNTTGLLDSTMLAGLSVTSSQDYNSLGELANLHYSWGVGGSYLESLTRGGAGRIIMRTEAISADTTRTTSYVYTTAGRLKDVLRGANLLEHYEYDANGNRMFAAGASLADSASATYDDQDRLLRYKDTRYSYTANGELAQKVQGSETTTYTYDPLGNLVTVVLPNQDRIDYLIDGRNRRVGRKWNGVLERGWLYQNRLNPVAELDGSGNVTARYVYGSSDHVPDYVVKGGSTYRLVTDHLGSVRLVVNASTGAEAEWIDYDAWGRVRQDTSPGFVCFGYAGGLSDAATGLVRFGARDYDPGVGRWTSKDPAGLVATSFGMYAYLMSSPIAGTDPSGRAPLYGNWGGPNWRNGMPGTELGNYPHLPNQPGFDRPIDARDECFREHDTNLRECAKIADPIQRQNCRREADIDLASCLARIGDRGCENEKYRTSLEQFIFWFIMPNGLGPGAYSP